MSSYSWIDLPVSNSELGADYESLTLHLRIDFKIILQITHAMHSNLIGLYFMHGKLLSDRMLFQIMDQPKRKIFEIEIHKLKYAY